METLLFTDYKVDDIKLADWDSKKVSIGDVAMPNPMALCRADTT